MSTATCVQCLNQMDYAVDDKYLQGLIFVCVNPHCPNFGLLSICLEKMPKESQIEHEFLVRQQHKLAQR